MDIVAAGDQGTVAAYEWKNGALSIKPGWPVSTTSGGQSPEGRGMAAGDLDGDGKIEVVVTTTNTSDTGSQVFVFSPNGKLYQPADTSFSPVSVQIYTSGSPSRPHKDVALLEVEQTHGLNQQGRAIMLDHLRARAAQMGCDAVVVGGIRERDGAQPGSGFDLLDPGSTTLHATCIRFTDKLPLSTTPARKVTPAPVTESSNPSADNGSCRAP
jgi:hypothetical protein